MFNKKTLLALEVPGLPKDRSAPIYRATAIEYLIRARLAMNRKVLVVAFYDRESALGGFDRPTAVLYQTQDDYRTLLRRDGRELWKKARISHVLDFDRYREAPVLCLRPRDERTIRNFLRLSRERHSWEPEDILSHIQRCQCEILDRRNRARKALLVQQVDDFMKQVPALPAAFDRWLDREPLKKSRYAYYRRLTKRRATCHCTHCRETFGALDTANHVLLGVLDKQRNRDLMQIGLDVHLVADCHCLFLVVLIEFHFEITKIGMVAGQR